MAQAGLSIANAIEWVQELPYPQWDLIEAWIKTQDEANARERIWNDVLQQWLDTLAESLAGYYCVDESSHFLMLAPQSLSRARGVLKLAEKARETLLDLAGLTAFDFAGKSVVVVLESRDVYYDYISAFYSEGEFGGSAGLFVRNGYPHVIICGEPSEQVERTLVHELTHASLSHRSLPQWIEEGLAQMFEHDMVGGTPFALTTEMGREQKSFWQKHGTDLFWSGDGFHRADDGQKLSYQLSEVLMRMLFSDYRARWFGFDKRQPARLLQFLCAARGDDGGESAACDHLGLSLHFFAHAFLGPGDWRPRV